MGRMPGTKTRLNESLGAREGWTSTPGGSMETWRTQQNKTRVAAELQTANQEDLPMNLTNMKSYCALVKYVCFLPALLGLTALPASADMVRIYVTNSGGGREPVGGSAADKKGPANQSTETA